MAPRPLVIVRVNTAVVANMVVPLPGPPARSDGSGSAGSAGSASPQWYVMRSTPPATPPGTATAGASLEDAKQHLFGLLREAERNHRETLERALNAERQVEQLRKVFQRWQLQLHQQRQQHQLHVQQQLQIQQHVHNEMQAQVQRQMQTLHDALLRQQTTFQAQQLQMRERLDEVYTFQRLTSYTQHQELGSLQLQLYGLERTQESERRHRQVLQRQVEVHSRRWMSRAPPCPPPPSVPSPCPDGDCCPCEFPEECPFNPCVPEDCCSVKIPEGPEDKNCLLRDIRLGFVESTPCRECVPQKKSPKRKRKALQNFVESESGYEADDEASIVSESASGQSSSFVEERRLILQEVRSLNNTRIVPRYKQIWKPLRCFHCGERGHLATFCQNERTTVL